MRYHKTTALAAAALIAFLAAGCTPPSTTAPSPGPSGSGLPSGVAQAGNVPTKVPNDPALRTNVTITDCSKTDKGWHAAGKASNPTNKPISYTITVFFTTDQATVLSTADTTVTVDPGKNADWNIEKDFATTPKTLCALRGVGTA
jgi:hypothetical protein